MIPYRTETERLVLRAFEPRDAPELAALVTANVDHLRPHLPWAKPMTADDYLPVLRGFRSAYDRDEDYVMAITLAGRIIGGIGIHPRLRGGGLEIGYWVSREHQRQGYVTEAGGAATQIALQVLGRDRVEILVPVGHHRSAAVPQRLGYTREGVRGRYLALADEGLNDAEVWVMFVEDLAHSPAGRVAMRAFDPLGRTVVSA